ncbi:MAG: carbohydrate binding domain-containing protein [Trueperaceae bacterium]
MRAKELWIFTLLLLLLGGCVQTTPSTTNNTASNFENFEPIQAQAVKTYYVSGSGSDSNNGTSQSTPFRTLQKAANLTNPGDTVSVMNGTYTKTVSDKKSPDNNVLRINRAGRSDAYITYKALSGHSPRIFVDNNYAGIRINVPYITIEGFTIEGNLPNISYDEAYSAATGTDTEVALNNSKFNSSGIMVFNNEGLTRDQITEFNFPHHIIIRRNKIFNHPSAGIGANSSDYIRIEDNLVHNTSYYSAYAASGISFYSNWNYDNSTSNKMFIRRNTVYKAENKVPFWYSNESNPSQRKITDGNGIIIDDANHTQSDNVPYVGGFMVENNLVYDNGGRGINVYESQRVTVRNNTAYRNGRTTDFSEIGVQAASNVTFNGNIFSARTDRKPIFTYDSSNITFTNNIFYGGSEAPQFPPSNTTNLIRNGNFASDLSNWTLSAPSSSGYVNNVRDEYGRNCLYVNQANLPNTYDVYVYQTDLTLKQGFTYNLSFDVATSNITEAGFNVKFGDSSSPYALYAQQSFSLPVNSSATSSKTMSFKMTNATDTTAQIEFQVAGNSESSYFCFDNIKLVENTNLMSVDPKFVTASTDPASVNFRLQQSSPAVNAQFTSAPSNDITNTARPKGSASDLGAYESY